MLWIGFCVVLWAWCLLSLGMPRHHDAVLLRPSTQARRRVLRGLGWILLLAGFAWFVGWKGWELGTVFWAAALMLSAIAWVLAMALVPRRSLMLPTLASVTAVAGLLTGAG